MSTGFVWNGKERTTFGETMEAVCAIETEDEAQRFMAAYRAFTPHADENIGYGSGYYDTATMLRIQHLFNVAHPIFGRSSPTPEEAFAMGEQDAIKRGGETTKP